MPSLKLDYVLPTFCILNSVVPCSIKYAFSKLLLKKCLFTYFLWNILIGVLTAHSGLLLKRQLRVH